MEIQNLRSCRFWTANLASIRNKAQHKVWHNFPFREIRLEKLVKGRQYAKGIENKKHEKSFLSA